MADQEEGPEKKIEDVVSDVTVKALREMSTGDMDKPPSRPPSGKAGSRPGSAAKPPSARGSRPSSAAAKPSSNPASPAGSARGSKVGSVAGSPKAGSPAGSARGSKAGSVAGSPKPGSKVGSPAGSKPTSRAGSRSGSRAQSPALGDDELVLTGRSAASDTKPSADVPEAWAQSGSVRSGSGRSASSRASSRAASDRPVSGKPGSGRPGSGKPGSDRPGSGRPDSDRPGSGRPGSDRPGSGRPGSGRPRSSARGAKESQPDSMLDDLAAFPQDEPDKQQAYEPEQDPEHDAGPMDEPEDNDDMPPQTMDYFGGGGGGSDGGSGDEDEDEEELEDEEEDDDDDEEMVVLDPDHPLMRRFQQALTSHLDKQNEKVTLELKELQNSVKNRKKGREDLGVDLYGVQQELARHQMILEKYHDGYSNMKQSRQQIDAQLDEVRDLYKNKQLQVNEEKKTGAELQQEVENLALRIFYMDNAKEDVRSDIAVMKRAAEKADTEVSKAELEKQQQDLYVDRLVERVDKLREEIAMYEAQQSAQTDETKSAKEALSEAHMEIEAISLEKKQLFQQWNSSLIGMRRRDEAHAAMNEALTQQQQQIMSLETEIEGYKKSITTEQEQNEKLTMVLNKTEVDIATVRKMLIQCQSKHDALKNEYATYTRMLHETEQALNRAMTDKTLRQNELNALRKQIEREYLEKVRLEDEILEKLRSQLTMDKAAVYTDKLTGKMRQRTKDLEAQVAIVENEISKDTLEVSNTLMRIDRLKHIMDGLDEEVAGKNEIISKSESEIIKRNAVIERKQGVIDQYNKRLELLIQSAGGQELGPLEININSLQKSIEAEIQEIAELQQMWLRDQSELVHLSKDKDTQSTDVENLKKQLTILSQKKLRIEGEINGQSSETSDIERSIRNMQNDMLKLNMLLHKEKGYEHNLQQGTVLMESDFVGSLKEAERESIEMQAQLDSLKEEKERLLNSLVEAERQIMLWEKKTQLARETRAAVDSEIGQGEIRAMKAEIHRMQVRYTQLMKQQERMIQEMEKAVSRRDTIVTRGDAQSKMNKKVLTKGTFQRQMAESKKKIKKTISDASDCDSEIKELRGSQQDLSQQLEEKQLNVQQLQSTTDTLDGDVDRLLEQKHKGMTDLLSKQQKSKYYQQMKDGKYTRLCKTDTALDAETEKQMDRMQTLNAITDRLNQEFPHVQPALRKVTVAFSSRGITGADDL